MLRDIGSMGSCLNSVNWINLMMGKVSLKFTMEYEFNIQFNSTEF